MIRAILLLSALIAASLSACAAPADDRAVSGSQRMGNSEAAGAGGRLVDVVSAGVRRVDVASSDARRVDVVSAGAAPVSVARAEMAPHGVVLADPGGAQPLHPASLLRRWVPLTGPGSAHPEPPFVEFRPDGTWIGSDGCNGLSGTWSAGQTGQWQATLGPSTMIFCDNVPVGLWIERAARVNLDGNVLVLRDGLSQELGRLRPA